MQPMEISVDRYSRNATAEEDFADRGRVEGNTTVEAVCRALLILTSVAAVVLWGANVLWGENQ